MHFLPQQTMMEIRLFFNEINYKSDKNREAEDWVEIYNWGRFDLDISGWILKDCNDDHAFIIPENTILKSNAYLVI